MRVILVVLALLFMVAPVYGQEANVTVQIKQPLGPEEDIQWAVLYVSPTGEDSEYAEGLRVGPITPLDPEQEDPILLEYRFYVAPETEVERHFKTSFIDTSGNESDLSDPVKVRIDTVPPGKPVSPTIDAVEVAP